jgi:ADP-ribosylglycohydrolase
MIGAIAGDIIGSVHEFVVTKTTDFVLFHPDCRFTDDTVLTIAVADCLLSKKPYVSAFHHYYRQYPHAVGWAFETLDEVLTEAKRSAEPTHNHPEGIKGAQATAAAIFLGRRGKSKQEIRASIANLTGYNLDRRLDDIRPSYIFDETCQGTVPEAVIAFLESENYEDAVRKAVSLGGDADTLACITGSIAEAFYGGVPEPIKQRALGLLDPHLRSVVTEFSKRYNGS